MALCAPCLVAATPTDPPSNPILFVTQVPIPADFSTIGAVFSNHLARMATAGRGGDLWIRYPDGTLRNLTAEAGYGSVGFQGANAIGVRDPAVHWSGTKAVFSMVVGAPTHQYHAGTWFWQLYEITGLGQGQTISIARLPNQPANYNNVSPTYGSDGSIIFVSDQPRGGQAYLYPQMDEYESQPSPTGMWKLNPAGNSPAIMLNHAPSGAFTPIVDSFGRVVFTRWDHLQRDQQADAGNKGAFNWSSEAANAVPLNTAAEVFPEPRTATSIANGLVFNEFFPWALNQDGSSEEVINHIGRHELIQYFQFSLKNDPNLVQFIAPQSPVAPAPLRVNQKFSDSWLQLVEDPLHPGRFVGINAPEFYTHASGQIIALTAPPGVTADHLQAEYLTPFSGSEVWYGSNGNPPADFTGRFRNPLPLSNGGMIAAYTTQAGIAANLGTRSNPVPNYNFRLYSLTVGAGGYLQTGAVPLTPGISKNISYYDPDYLVTYNGPLWELSPVEVRARAVPPTTTTTMESPEIQAFAQANVDPNDFRSFLAARGLAVLVSRNVTTRDAADRQQPFNLRVPGGVQTLGNSGLAYDISYMQFFQGDLIRSLGGIVRPSPGRRVLAQPLHDSSALAFAPPPPSGAPAGSVAIANDGSMAAIVPAQRALSWQSTNATGTPVVRERYWISAMPGEVRACGSCHGVNDVDQAGQPPPQNVPQALVELVAYWRDHHEVVFKNGFD